MGILSADTAENGADAIREILKSGAVDLLILDSISGMSPEKEQEDSLADANMALLARLLSKGIKQYTTLLDKHKTTMLVINQIRMKPGVMYGNPETTTGGNALKYFSHIIAKVTKTKVIEKGKNSIGIISKIKTTKNKCATPFREKEMYIMFPHEENGVIKSGIDIIEDLIPEAIAQGIIVQKGASYTWRDIKIHSKDKVVEHFKANPELLDILREDLLNNDINSTSTETEENIHEEDTESEE